MSKTVLGYGKDFPPPLDPRTIPKYVTQLPIPNTLVPHVVRNPATDTVIRHSYRVFIMPSIQQILPKPFPATPIWSYGGIVFDSRLGTPAFQAASPGPTFEALRGIPARVHWVNAIVEEHVLPVDPTLHWANPNNMPENPPKPWPEFPPGFREAQSPVPIVTHLHGGEVPSAFDGHPNAWFTYNGITGPAFVSFVYDYPNRQAPATLWYHDHALGITRLNVMTGLAGMYILRDPNDPVAQYLPPREFEIPLVIQDRSFNQDGTLSFPNEGNNPDIHPYWVPEFIGNTIMVNGAVWPNLCVKRRQYRFRILNGSNSRFYELSLSSGQKLVQIGSDGGYLPTAVELDKLLIGPGERADVLIDFSGTSCGEKILMLNTAPAPFPGGDPPDPGTVGQVMQFTVVGKKSVPPKPLPPVLNEIPVLTPDSPKRTLTLNEVMDSGGPVMLLLNGQKWDAPVSELPRVGSTEDWEFVNTTGDSHPTHLHLVQFLLVNRQNFRAEDYLADWIELNGQLPLNKPTITLPVDPYLEGDPIPPPDNERGWKDTIQVHPGQVTRIRVRFAPQNADPVRTEPGVNLYPFDPTTGPGYVWHCHILDHEDNEMMRPYRVKK